MLAVLLVLVATPRIYRTRSGGRLLPGLDGNGGRLVIDAICYVADDGIERRNLPAGHGIHWKTLHAIFARWGRDGFTIALHDDLREEVRGGRRA